MCFITKDFRLPNQRTIFELSLTMITVFSSFSKELKSLTSWNEISYQAQAPPDIRLLKSSSLISSEISNLQETKQTSRHSGYNSGICHSNKWFEKFLNFTYCNDLIDAVNIKHIPNQRRLFINASKSNFKACLIHRIEMW